MSEVLDEHEGKVSIAGRTINNLRFADDIDGLAGSEQELAQLDERIDQTSKAYGMEINEFVSDWLTPLSLGTMSASAYIENLA